MKIKCPNTLSYTNFKNIIIPKKNNEKKHIHIISIYPVLKTRKNNSKIKHNFETVNNNYNRTSNKSKKSKPKILNVIWKKDLKKNIPKVEKETKNDNNSTISNFLNYNLGEFNNEQDFEEDFFEKKLDPFIISLIDKKKKKNIKDEIKPENNVSEKEFDLSNCIKFKEEINNIKKEKGNRFDIHYEKRNISELTQNNSYYYSNTEELKPSEKIHSIYNSKFSLIKKT